MRALLCVVSLLLATPAAAQISNPGAGTDDTARAMAQAASDAAAAKCDPMQLVPPPEVVGGSAGTGAACRLANSVQPRISRFVPFTTSSDGTATVTWPTMTVAPPGVNIQEKVAASATNIPKCFEVLGTITATGVTVKCYITQSILGLGIAPFTAASAGVTGTVIALPAS